MLTLHRAQRARPPERKPKFGLAIAGGGPVGAIYELGALRALDTELAHELKVSGRAPWQVLAGAASGNPALKGTLLHEDAPYGVGYLVATWA